MTLISRIFLLSLLLTATLATAEVEETTACRVESVDILGLSRTDPDWFKDYVNVVTPVVFTDADAATVRSRLITTDIFTDVQVELKHITKDQCSLEIQIKEKWTLIPVVRAAYGGGTPLTVLGGYETNAFGKLNLIGGELRRYGTMPPGFFLYGKSPRAWRGQGSVGSELWLDRRRRAFFDADGNLNGYADSEALTGKFQILTPLSTDDHGLRGLQSGVQVEVVQESPTTFNDKNLNEDASRKPGDVSVPDRATRSAVIMPMLALDRLIVDRMTLSGTRALAKVGGQVTRDKIAGATELEVFSYLRLAKGLNFANHFFAGSQGSDSLRNLYFLGGFDSVRGLPDGIHYGTKAAYLNSELTWMAAEMKYLDVQSALFLDHGSAFSRTEEFASNRETAVGFGLRFSVPQVYRLLVRIDYGKSIGSTKSQGFSIGLGQFFQPYRLFY